MKRAFFHREAELEMWQAVDYYEGKCKGLGLDFARESSLILADIQESPGRYPIGKHGTRRRLLSRFPYTSHYLEFQDSIWIVAVAHTSRKPYYWRKRLNKQAGEET